MVLQAFDGVDPRQNAVFEHDMRLDNLTATLIRSADDRAFLDVRMR